MSSAVEFSAVQVPLALFAEAVLDEPVGMEPVEVGDCWPWQFAVSRVRVPVQLDLFDAPEANRRAMRSIVLHQLVALEVERERDPSAVADMTVLEQVAFDVLLSTMVDARTRRRYPGSAAPLGALGARLRNEPAGTDLLEPLRFRSLGADPAELTGRFPHVPARILGLFDVEAEAVEAPGATAQDCAAGARRIAAALGTGLRHVSASADEHADPQTSDTPGVVDDQPGGVSLDASGVPAEVEPSDDVTGGQPASEAGSQAMTQSDRKPSAHGLRLPSLPGPSLGPEVRTFVYDEWDYRAQAHRPAWCRVVEERLAGDDFSFITEVRGRHFALRGQIRRTFAKLRPADLVRVHRSDDGDELDLDAVIEALVDRRGGAPVEERLHIRRDRAARDVATAFLVDLSASTSTPAHPAEPEPAPPNLDPFDDPLSYAPWWSGPQLEEPVRRVIDVAKEAVALMSDALHELGDAHAIYGFSGTGRHGVEFKVAKSFGERVSGETWSALAQMKPRHYTRMGPAIRHATAQLAAEPARVKFLIMISDGYPQDVDYGDDNRDKSYGVEDTARAVADAGALGVTTFCVTIDPAGHDYLRAMFPENQYLVIDDVEALPSELARVYVSLSSGHRSP